MEPLVSVITCCYNGERFVDRWAESLLKQTYEKLEILFVDDGSTDESCRNALVYKQAFEEKGYVFKYYQQENQGIGGATNVGLLNMTGDYFMIYDIDDVLYENCIKARVKYLEDNTDCGLVLTNGHYAHESNLNEKVPVEYYSPNITAMKEEKEYIFEEIILGKRVCSTCPYMHRTRYYLEVNPRRTIYPTRYQQDTQVTMISSFKYKCGYIDEAQYMLVGCDNSHSHSMKKEKNINELIAYRKSTKEAKSETLNILPISYNRKQKYQNIIEGDFLKSLNYLFMDLKNKEETSNIIPDRISIFGAGVYGRKIFKIASFLNIEVECFFDNNIMKKGEVIDGVIVYNISQYNPTELKEKYIVIASKAKQCDIHNQLEGLGLHYQIDFCHYQDFLACCKDVLDSYIEFINSLS